jgi:ribosomal protein L31E
MSYEEEDTCHMRRRIHVTVLYHHAKFIIRPIRSFCKNHYQTQSLQIVFFEDHDV